MRALPVAMAASPLLLTLWPGAASAGLCDQWEDHCHDALVSPAIGTIGEDFFVGWVDYSHHRRTQAIRGRALGLVGSGVVLGEEVDVETPETTGCSTMERSFFLLWDTFDDDPRGDLRAGLVCRDGMAMRVTNLPIAVGPAAQRRPAAARDATAFLSAWVEDAEGIRARRLGWRGELLDEPALAVSEGADGATHPAASSNGRQFLLVWDEPAPEGRLVRAARVKHDGSVVDPGGFDLDPARVRGDQVDLDSNGDGFLMTWRASSPSYGIAALRLDAEGRPVGEVVRLAEGADTSSPVVATDGQGYLVVWRRGARIEAALVRPDQAEAPAGPADALVLATDAAEMRPSVNSNGGVYVVAWTAERSAGAGWYDLRGARVSTDGEIIDAPGFSIAVANDHSGEVMTCAVSAGGAGGPRISGGGVVLVALAAVAGAWGRQRRRNRQ